MADNNDGSAKVKARLEVPSAVLLAVAALATSWIGYQNTKWSGRQNFTVTEGLNLREKCNRAASEASVLQAVDVGLFTNWVNAYASGNTPLDSFYREHFRKEFKPAFVAWIAQHPRTNPDASPTPFSLPEYRLEKKMLADRLEDSSEAKITASRKESEIKDAYVIKVVLLALALFFVGISRNFARPVIQISLFTMAAILVLYTVVSILLLPVLF